MSIIVTVVIRLEFLLWCDAFGHLFGDHTNVLYDHCTNILYQSSTYFKTFISFIILSMSLSCWASISTSCRIKVLHREKLDSYSCSLAMLIMLRVPFFVEYKSIYLLKINSQRDLVLFMTSFVAGRG